MRLKSCMFLLCAVTQAFVIKAEANGNIEFTPESLMEAVDARSTVIRLDRLIEEESDANISVAKNALTPDISASLQLGYLGDGYLTDRNFSNGMHVANPPFVNNFGIEAAQLIYAGGAVKNSIKLAEIQKKLALVSGSENRQRIYFLLLSNLIDLDCLYRQRNVLQTNIELANSLLTNMRNRFAEGVALKSDITRYELQVSELELQLYRVMERISNLNAHISNTLDYPEGTEFSFRGEEINENYSIPDLSVWQQRGSAENFDIQKAKIGIDMSDTQIKIANSERLPHIGAFVYGMMNSPITTEVPVLDKNFMFWGLGVNISYNISSLYKTNRTVKRARLALSENKERLELTKETVRDDITSAYNSWVTANRDLRTQRAALRLAEENYDIISKRFEEGMAIVTDLVDAANIKIAAQTGVDSAESRLAFCLYRLKYLTNSL